MTKATAPAPTMISTRGMEDLNDGADESHRTYIVLTIDNEQYAIEVAAVSEIIRIPALTNIVDVGQHIRGVANLRGRILPVLDLRSRLHGKPAVTNDRSMLVVIDDEEPAALLVDSVREVISLDSNELERIPASKRQSGSPSILRGIARSGDRILVVLDVALVMEHEFHRSIPGGVSS